MDKNIFGSTSSLGGLLNEALFNEGEADQFLQELGGPVNKGFDIFSASAGSASGVASNLSGEAGFNGDAISGSLVPADLPVDSSALSQEWTVLPAPPTQPQTQPTQATQLPNPLGNLALLSQLLGVLKNAQPPNPEPQPTTSNLVAQFGAAFKPSTPPAQAFAPVSQAKPEPVQLPASKSTLPSLNAQQQQALQTIMSLGQLGNTTEGKKVRRMLSNRESARRSRHRKQAHVQELEDRAARLEIENSEMKESLARATRVEIQATEERIRMSLELDLLRQKVAQLQDNPKTAEVKLGSAHKRGNSRGSSAGAGHASEDSCCDSMPAVRRVEQPASPCCKRCRLADCCH